jgi:hypothetical protein
MRRPKPAVELSILALGILLGSTSANAKQWVCSNQAAEISCGKTGCNVAEGFTPMSVGLDTKGKMSVCAYSGCWEGKASKIVKTGSYTTFYSNRLKWSQNEGTGPSYIDASVTIDRRQSYATMLAAGYAHPMTCKLN